MMSLSGNGGRTIERPPFTPTQWQELENQALIYKYMVSGVPVPPELIFSIRRSLDSSLVSRLLPHQSIGWGCYQMGFGRKPDPEPGRCRRTDGKKWRCSREAYPDSKYCEKHMHRGRNRARKSIDQNQTTAPLTSPSLSFPNNNNPSPTLSSSSSTYSASSSSPSIDAYSNINRLGVGNSNSRGYFNNHSLDYPYPLSSPKQQQQQQTLHHASALSLHQNASTASQFNALASATDHKDFRQDHQEEEEKDSSETKKSLHHFFGEDWAQNKNSSDSWLDLSSHSRLDTGS
ncbi:hypothetical protein IGI04_020489 [Brassica rapa subsp. trilocularis]|uniref:Growth-regulating factor n=1 Tax=Brassica rapa subsp. trilocularis TaxID=1813537 RepID=A0ABQ7MJQ0_BRACM|nr:hypothetical protein IGI04_020489 [Brassica rapa subsp. trilocularis]